VDEDEDGERAADTAGAGEAEDGVGTPSLTYGPILTEPAGLDAQEVVDDDDGGGCDE